VLGAERTLAEAKTRLDHIQVALRETPGEPELSALAAEARTLEAHLDDLAIALSGDPVVAGHNEPTPPSIVDRVQRVISGQWSSTSAPTATHQDGYRIASEEFSAWLPGLRQAVEDDLRRLEDRMEAAGAPWTPGRVPRFTPEP
jgi:hypothetical protein